MHNITLVNPALSAGKTLLNGEYAAWQAREDGQALPLAPGMLILGKYLILEKLQAPSGEADLYLCEHGGRQFAAKVYRRRAAVKEEVLSLLTSLEAPQIARIHETADFLGKTVEILEYFPGGSLRGCTLTLEELETQIIPAVNEGLRLLHTQGILHKDLKPANLMRREDGSVALIDFGVSSVLAEGSTVLMTRTGMTPAYSAPETFRELYLAESDYYSFGVTLFELFTGRTPYEGLSREEVARYTAIQRFPLPEDMPQRLQELIAGLTYPDVTNRGDKTNPDRRWTWEEVDRWLRGEELPVPGGGVGRFFMRPYEFQGVTYREMGKLAEALALKWTEGMKHLYKGRLTAHFNTCNPIAAAWCRNAVAEATQSAGHDERIFWHVLHQMAPRDERFFWKGRVYQDMPALGREILDSLRSRTGRDNPLYDSILSEGMISAYVAAKLRADPGLTAVAGALEDKWRLIAEEKGNRQLAYYAAGYALSGQHLLVMDGLEIRTPAELAEHMRALLAESLEALKKFCHRLVDYDGTLDVQLEAWLTAIGRGEEIAKWRGKLLGTTEGR